MRKIIAGVFEKFVWETKSDRPKRSNSTFNAIEVSILNIKMYE